MKINPEMYLPETIVIERTNGMRSSEKLAEVEISRAYRKKWKFFAEPTDDEAKILKGELHRYLEKEFDPNFCVWCDYDMGFEFHPKGISRNYR